MDWNRGFSDAWSHIAETGPRVGAFLLLCLAGWLLVRAGARVLDGVVTRTGADRLLDRAGIARLLRRPAHAVWSGMLRILSGVALLGVLRMALGVFGPSAAGDTVADLLGLLLHALLAGTILLIGVGLARVTRTFVAEALRDLSYGRTTANIVAGVLVVAFGKAGLDEVGLATSVTTPLLWAALASITGVIVVGVGGGLIRPMQIRWEEILEHAEDTAEQTRATLRNRRATGDPAAPGSPTDPGDSAPVTTSTPATTSASVTTSAPASSPAPTGLSVSTGASVSTDASVSTGASVVTAAPVHRGTHPAHRGTAGPTGPEPPAAPRTPAVPQAPAAPRAPAAPQAPTAQQKAAAPQKTAAPQKPAVSRPSMAPRTPVQPTRAGTAAGPTPGVPPAVVPPRPPIPPPGEEMPPGPMAADQAPPAPPGVPPAAPPPATGARRPAGKPASEGPA